MWAARSLHLGCISTDRTGSVRTRKDESQLKNSFHIDLWRLLIILEKEKTWITN